MTITVCTQRSPELINQLVDVWEQSVTATHTFLSEAEIAEIKTIVPSALMAIPRLLIIRHPEIQQPVAFMGIDTPRLEMLFIAPAARGQGLGRQLLQYAIQREGVTELDVNEQNPQAIGFYEHLGFKMVHRSELDGQGKPYPILTMRLAQ